VQREPIFNIPTVVVALLFALAGVHLVRTLLLSTEQDVELLLTFAFIPARYDSSIVLGGALPGGGGAQVWTFVSYALLHADWTHYCLNAIWLLPFGSALARRFGAARYLVFFEVTAEKLETSWPTRLLPQCGHLTSALSMSDMWRCWVNSTLQSWQW